MPVAQAPIQLPDGGCAYPDLCYPDERLIIEVDSYRHHSSLADWEDDHVRNQSLVAAKWRIQPVTVSEIQRSPAAAAQKVKRALEP